MMETFLLLIQSNYPLDRLAFVGYSPIPIPKSHQGTWLTSGAPKQKHRQLGARTAELIPPCFHTTSVPRCVKWPENPHPSIIANRGRLRGVLLHANR